jgi:hypothetical protein
MTDFPANFGFKSCLNSWLKQLHNNILHTMQSIKSGYLDRHPPVSRKLYKKNCINIIQFFTVHHTATFGSINKAHTEACTIVTTVETTNTMHWTVPLLYSIYWLLHVLAVVCYHQGASWICLSYLKYRSNRRYIIQCMFTWPVCWSVVVPCICTQLGSTTDGTTTLRHKGHINIHCMIYHLFDLYFK